MHIQAVLSAAGISDTSNGDDIDDNSTSSSSSKCDTIRGIGGIPGNVFIGGNGPPKLQLLEHLQVAVKLANAQATPAATATAVATLTADTPSLKLYLEKFDIAPIQLHLSFTLAAAAHHAADSSGNHGVHSAAVDHTGDDTVSTGLASSSTSSSTATSTAANPLFLLVKAMGATLANIENAPLHMRQVSIRDKLASPQQLVALLIGHYTRQALGQAYKIVGSAELLGNPIGLLQSLGAGIKDFFYEPALGLSHGSPKEFILGIIRGTSSLSRSVICSCVDTSGAIASSIANGMLASGAISFRLPRGHIIYPTGIATGVVLGMVGLARDPVACIQMRKQSSIIGVTRATLRGCGKGVLGLGMRPLYGGLMTFVTMCRTIGTTLDPRLGREQKSLLKRSRPPRYFRQIGQPLTVYSADENEGEESLHRVSHGKYRSEGYVYHARLQGAMIILVTEQRLLLLQGNCDTTGARHGCMVNSYSSLVWEVSFSSILLIESSKATTSTDNAIDSSTQEQQHSTAITTAASCAIVVCHLPPLLEGSSQGLRIAARTLYFTSTKQAAHVAKVVATRAPWATIDVAPANNSKSVSTGVRAAAQKVRPIVVSL
eukprot:19594-Heterococcus_DN1.PRE.4